MTRWIGKERFRRRLLAIPERAKAMIQTALEQGAQEIVDMQKRLVAVDDGALRDSIVWQRGGDKRIKYSQGSSQGNRIGVRISAGNTRVRYAHIVEFGAAPHIAGGVFKGAQHPGAPAQPFFYPVYRARKRSVKARVRRAIKKAVLATRGA